MTTLLAIICILAFLFLLAAFVIGITWLCCLITGMTFSIPAVLGVFAIYVIISALFGALKGGDGP